MVPELECLNELDERGEYRLNDELYERCLRKIQENLVLNKGREGKKYECGAGVRTRDDRVGGGHYGTEREKYNGRGGGRVFRWYSRPVFNNYLARMGASEESCTERQCMLALAATSDELRKYPMVTERLVPFLGPQCYPHMDRSSVEYRARANERVKGEDADGGHDSSQRQDDGGSVMQVGSWMKCQRAASSSSAGRVSALASR